MRPDCLTRQVEPTKTGSVCQSQCQSHPDQKTLVGQLNVSFSGSLMTYLRLLIVFVLMFEIPVDEYS